MSLSLHRTHKEGTTGHCSPPARPSQAPDAYRHDEALVRLVRQPVRQALLRALATREALSFTDIKRMLSITDGNLSTHARKLVDAGIINCMKGFRRQFPRTEYSLTPAGKVAVERFLDDKADVA